MGGLIEKFDTEKALNILKEWIENPLKEGTYDKIKVALLSLDKNELDDERALEILGREEY